MEIGYKVLSFDRNSAMQRGVGERQYPVKEWVTPAEGCGPLAVFGSYETAFKFSFLYLPAKHLGLQAKKPRPVVKCLFIPEPYEEKLFVPGARWSLSTCPMGTVLARAVCCLE